MVRSRACRLHDVAPREVAAFGECEYDEGGYFVVNGNEKVLIAQERMSNNHPFVFRGVKSSGKYSYVAELRSSKESTIGFRPTATLMIKFLSAGSKKGYTPDAWFWFWIWLTFSFCF
jgi:DNA-directed RNA polymerase II subunit RPB2